MTQSPESGKSSGVSLPRAFRLPDEWDELRTAIHASHGSEALEAVLDLAKQHDPTRALLEPDYIDADYRNEYANFYAQTFREISDRCRRLHFFKTTSDADTEEYLGFSVLRPIRTRPVGRTFIAPPAGLAPHISCATATFVRPYGQELEVTAFPFMEQDAQLGVCAHASAWMVALYHHLAHVSARHFVSDIAQGANSVKNVWRSTPSDGLTDEQVGGALQKIGLSPVAYPVSDPPAGVRVSEVVCRYLNSRLPVVLTTPGHVTVLIGYGRDDTGQLFFIRSDEGTGPYVRVYEQEDPLGRWDLLIVPLPGRIYLPGEAAELTGQNLFRGLLRRPEHQEVAKTVGRMLRLRTYVCEAGEYKANLASRGLPAEAVILHQAVGTSRWIWIVELQDPRLAATTRECVLGEIAIDATSDRLDPNPLFGNLPGYSYIWSDDEPTPRQREISGGTPYLSATALHDTPAGGVAKPPKRPRRWRHGKRQR